MTNTKEDTPGLISIPPHHECAARALKHILELFHQHAPDLGDREAETAMTPEAGPDGQARLMTQAQLLDAVFHRLALDSFSAKTYNGQPIPGYKNLDCLNMALRAQKQCRATIETLGRYAQKKDERTGKET